MSTRLESLNKYCKKKQMEITAQFKKWNDYRKSKEHWQKVIFFILFDILTGVVDYVQDLIQTDEHLR